MIGSGECITDSVSMDTRTAQINLKEVLENHMKDSRGIGRETVSKLSDQLKHNIRTMKFDIENAFVSMPVELSSVESDEAQELRLVFHTVLDVGKALLSFVNLEDSEAALKASNGVFELCTCTIRVPPEEPETPRRERMRRTLRLWNEARDKAFATKTTVEHLLNTIQRIENHVQYKTSDDISLQLSCLYTLGLLVDREYLGWGSLGDGYEFIENIHDQIYDCEPFIKLCVSTMHVSLPWISSLLCGVCSGHFAWAGDCNVHSRSITAELVEAGILEKMHTISLCRARDMERSTELLESLSRLVESDDDWFWKRFADSGWIERSRKILEFTSNVAVARRVTRTLARMPSRNETTQASVNDKLDVALMKFALDHNDMFAWEALSKISQKSQSMWQRRFECFSVDKGHVQSSQTKKFVPADPKAYVSARLVLLDLCSRAHQELLNILSLIETCSSLMDDAVLLSRMVEVVHFRERSVQMVDRVYAGCVVVNQKYEEAETLRTLASTCSDKACKIADRRRSQLSRKRQLSNFAISHDTPEDLLCPITQELLVDPVVASDGHTYERCAIERVINDNKKQRKSPMTRETLAVEVYTNLHARAQVDRLLEGAVPVSKIKAASQILSEWELSNPHTSESFVFSVSPKPLDEAIFRTTSSSS